MVMQGARASAALLRGSLPQPSRLSRAAEYWPLAVSHALGSGEGHRKTVVMVLLSEGSTDIQADLYYIVWELFHEGILKEVSTPKNVFIDDRC